MTEVCTFRGIRYNQALINDITQVICPPYDVVNPEQQKLYYEKNSYNAIRLEHPLAYHYDGLKNNRYTRAAVTFKQWLEQEILKVDAYPAFYLHDHYFIDPLPGSRGKEKKRRGLVVLVRLEPWGREIHPHEETFPKAKEDRLQLMRACRASCSPLLALYQDPERSLSKVLAQVDCLEPIIDSHRKFDPHAGERHVIWAINDPELQQQIGHLLAPRALYMADGHHRYETALAYQRERTQGHSDSARCQKGAFNYVMMTLVDISDPGLVILPVHRLVRGIEPSALAGLQKQLEKFFILESLPLNQDFLAPWHNRPQLRAERENNEAICKILDKAIMVILGLEPQSMVVLKQCSDVSIEAMMSSNYSKAYKTFGLSVLNHIILEKFLGIIDCGADHTSRNLGQSEEKSCLSYTEDISEACQQIREGAYQLAFLLGYPQPEIIKDIAEAGDRMPRKSTYFYPKLPAGLVINSLD